MGVHEILRQNEEIPDMSVTPDADFPVIFAEKGIVNYGISAPAHNGGEGISVEVLSAGEAPNMVASSARAVLRVWMPRVMRRLKPFRLKMIQN